MANYRALALDPSGLGNLEIKDADVLQIGNVAPAAGNLTIGGAAGSNVVVTTTQTLSVSGVGGGINLTGSASILAAAGSTLSGFDSIEGILSTDLLDKSAPEIVSGQWTFRAPITAKTFTLIKASGLEVANDLLFQIQTSAGANLFSVDLEGDVNIAGGETVAGTTIYTGNVTLGDGGNTIKVGGSPLGAGVNGDTVILSTLAGAGGVNGNFSISSANFNVDTAGILDTNGNVIVVNADAAGGTTDLSGAVWLDGNGVATVEGWRFRNNGAVPDFRLQYKAGPINAKNLSEAWTDIFTATPSGFTVNVPISGAIAGNGTNSNVWVTNLDAAGGTNEDSMLVSAAGDGANLQAWRWFNDSSTKNFELQYAQNPADLINTTTGYTLNAMVAHSTGIVDFTYNVNAQAGLDVTGAALTADANGIDCGGGIDLNGTLSFDGVAANVIDNSATNTNLSISLGTGSLLVTSDLVDLRTNVKLLDIPAGSVVAATGLSIGGVKLTSANFTAANVDKLVNGSNADALHVHAAAAATQVTVTNINTTAMTQYYAGYIDGSVTDRVAANTDCSAATGSLTTASFAGVCTGAPGAAGSLVINGEAEVQFEAGILPIPKAGEPALLSRSVAGRFINTAVGAPNNSYVTRVGTILDASTYNATNRCKIIIYPGHPVKK